jgi:hypothetical protein
MNVLEISNGIKISNPSNEEIKRYINSFSEEKYEFIILKRDEQTFIQTALADSGKFIVEYRLGGNNNHYTSKGTIDIEKVVKVFEGFANKTSNWRNKVDWEKIDLYEPIKTYKRLNLIGYIPLLFFLAMAIAMKLFDVNFNYWTNKILLSQWEFMFLCLNIGLLLQYPYSLHDFKYNKRILDSYAKLLQIINIFGTPVLTIVMLIYFIKVFAL